MPKPNTTSPIQIATRQGDGFGVIYLYGIVGQEGEWWLEREDQREEITAMAVVNALNDLAQTNDIIQLKINSPGGSVFEGEAIITAIQNCSAEVHTYNDGVAASMAAGIWLAGKKRFMGRNATMMIHAPISYCFGNSVQMREQADVLDKFTQASAEGMAALTDLSVEEVMSQFFADGKDHWMTFSDVEEMGFITSGESYEVEQPVTKSAQHLSYPEFLSAFHAKPSKEVKRSAFQRIRQLVGMEPEATITPENYEPVTSQELRAAIANGDITVDQLGEIHEELTTPAQTADEVLQETIRLAVTGAVEAAMADRDATITELRAEIQQLGDAPGDQPTGTAAPGDPGTNKPSAVQQDASMFRSWADNGFSPFRNPLTEVPAE